LARKIVVSKTIDGRVVGCGYGALGQGYVGVFDIIAKDGARGRGSRKRIDIGIEQSRRMLY
jgi:hypothetical protein